MVHTVVSNAPAESGFTPCPLTYLARDPYCNSTIGRRGQLRAWTVMVHTVVSNAPAADPFVTYKPRGRVGEKVVEQDLDEHRRAANCQVIKNSPT
jgi:hypothetical protein